MFVPLFSGQIRTNREAVVLVNNKHKNLIRLFNCHISIPSLTTMVMIRLTNLEAHAPLGSNNNNENVTATQYQHSARVLYGWPKRSWPVFDSEKMRADVLSHLIEAEI